MLKIKKYTQNDEAKVLKLIRKVQLDAKPDKEILSRCVLIKDDDDIVGMVSYESHDDMGIIRYFIYNACVAGADRLVEMFFELYKTAYTNNIKRLITKIPSLEVEKLFAMFGFINVADDSLNLKADSKQNMKIMLLNLEKSFE